jgi:hypothetical protein
MGISVLWDNRNRTIVRWGFDPDWVWEDIQEAWFETESLMEQVAHGVDVIVDMTETPKLPPDEPPPGILSRRLMPFVGSESMIVMVGCDTEIVNILLQWLQGRDELRANFAFMDTLEDAHLILYDPDDETYVEPQELYDLRWIAPDQIILVEIMDDLGIDAVESLNCEIEQMMASAVGLNISVVFDTSRATKLNARPVQLRTTLTFLQNPRMKWFVVVGANDIIRFVTSVVTQLTQHAPIFKQTREEAFALLSEMGVH